MVSPALSDDSKDESSDGAGAQKRDERLSIVRYTAYSLASQVASEKTNVAIRESLEEDAAVLDRAFSFAPYLLDERTLSPVVLESDRLYNQTSATETRTVTVSYSLFRPARLVHTPPTWRDYLLRTAPSPQPPFATALPRTKAERRVWHEGIDKGWEAGVQQELRVFDHGLRRLERDLTGMQRFLRLLDQRVVSRPQTGRRVLGVVKDGKTLNVNDVVHRITMPAIFTDDPNWEPLLRVQPGMTPYIEGSSKE